jgi:hypothetical protein
MKWIVAAWALPMGTFWGWYFLSAYNLHFGYVMLTRQVHDLVFEIYGQSVGIDPALLPALVARICVLDTLLVAALVAFRRRASIVAWLQARRGSRVGVSSGPIVAERRPSAALERPQPVEHALKHEGGGGRIDLAGALAAREIHLDQCALGGDGR